jgi:hypothetical protein
MSQPPEDKIYVIVSDGAPQEAPGEGPPGEAIRLPWGRNRAEPMDRAKLLDRFGNYTSLAGQMMERADKSTTGFKVDEITLHLGVSTDVGIAFIGQAGVEASIDVTLKRKSD